MKRREVDLSSLYQKIIRKLKDSAAPFDLFGSDVHARLTSGGIALFSTTVGTVELFIAYKTKIS